MPKDPANGLSDEGLRRLLLTLIGPTYSVIGASVAPSATRLPSTCLIIRFIGLATSDLPWFLIGLL